MMSSGSPGSYSSGREGWQEAVDTEGVSSYPAKIIKYRFENKIIKLLNNIKWYQFDPVRLRDLDAFDLQGSLNKMINWPVEWRTLASERHIRV